MDREGPGLRPGPAPHPRLRRALGGHGQPRLEAGDNQRGEAGDAAGAATAYEELLADYLRVLGPDHPDTLSNRGNLAYWRGEAGDAAGAATASEDQ